MESSKRERINISWMPTMYKKLQKQWKEIHLISIFFQSSETLYQPQPFLLGRFNFFQTLSLWDKTNLLSCIYSLSLEFCLSIYSYHILNSWNQELNIPFPRVWSIFRTHTNVYVFKKQMQSYTVIQWGSKYYKFRCSKVSWVLPILFTTNKQKSTV